MDWLREVSILRSATTSRILHFPSVLSFSDWGVAAPDSEGRLESAVSLERTAVGHFSQSNQKSSKIYYKCPSFTLRHLFCHANEGRSDCGRYEWQKFAWKTAKGSTHEANSLITILYYGMLLRTKVGFRKRLFSSIALRQVIHAHTRIHFFPKNSSPKSVNLFSKSRQLK